MWTFLLAAFAQEQICEPLAPDVLDARLQLAASALAELRMADADTELEIARDEARCLSVPIAADQLARLAWLHAEQAVLEQDEEELWRWVRLARDVAPSQAPPDHVTGDHPLMRFLASPPPLPPVTGPDRAVAHPRRGGVHLDGQRLELPRARAETVHLVQVFENKALVRSHWQSGARFDASLLADPVAVALVEDAAPTGPAKWKPAKKDTVPAWESWIVANPGSEWLDEARGRLDDVRWREARAAGEDGIRAYLADDPGRNARAARAALEQADFDRTAAEGTRQAWSLYLGRHPDGVFVAEASARLDELTWAEMQRQDTEEAYSRYLTQMRDGAHRAEARALWAERAWETASRSSDPNALKRFLAKHPQSRHRTEARMRLAGTRLNAVQLSMSGCPPCEGPILEALGGSGLRVATVPYVPSAARATFAEETGLLWVLATPGGVGERWTASAELWSPLGGAPLVAWRAEGADVQELTAALIKGLPDLSRWR